MAEIHSATDPLPYIPDDLTFTQFILDSQHPCRPLRKHGSHGSPWIIEDRTGRKLGHEEIRARASGLANGLKRRFDIKEDEVVLIFSPNHIDYLVTIWATHKLGAIMSGANPLFTPDELEYQIRETMASVLVTHPESLRVAVKAMQAVNLPADRIVLFDVEGASSGPQRTIQNLVDEGLANLPTFHERTLLPGEAKTKLALLFFSSGTTGRPKAVSIPHYALIANIVQLALYNKVNDASHKDQRFRPDDVCCAILPLYHLYGFLINTHLSFFFGMTVVLCNKFNFLDFLNSIVRHRITHLMVVPPHVVLLCKHAAVRNYDFSHVRYLICGAAPLSRKLIEQLAEIFPNAAIGQLYGSTEASGIITAWSHENKCDLSGSAGQIIPGVDARVERPDGSLAEFDEQGELVVRTPSISLGYAGNPQATKETFVNGWLRTGDEVTMNRKGDIFVLDRLKEMIKVKGFQVAPAELEGCIIEHPEVSHACIVGIPDEYSGELPFAFVVLRRKSASKIRSDPDAVDKIKESIIMHVADNKVGYKRLAGGVEFIDSIPTSPSGKILRRALRDLARDRLRPRPAAKL